MTMCVTDTHPLIWYAAKDHRKLSKRASEIFNRASRNEALIYIPTVVLWEMSLLVKTGVVRLSDPFNQWASVLLSRPGFELAPKGDEDIILSFSTFINTRVNDDPFDELIVATALNLDLPLITADSNITDSEVVEVVW